MIGGGELSADTTYNASSVNLVCDCLFFLDIFCCFEFSGTITSSCHHLRRLCATEKPRLSTKRAFIVLTYFILEFGGNCNRFIFILQQGGMPCEYV